MKRLEHVLKSLLFLGNEFQTTKDIREVESKAKLLMDELMKLTGLTYQAAEDLLINWIEKPEVLEEMTCLKI